MSRKRLSRGDGLIYEDTAMPDQILPNGFQPQDSPGIWGWDPALVMALSFVIVPIALAILVLAFQAVGRLLRGNASSPSAPALANDRFELIQRHRPIPRLEVRRYTAPRLKANTIWQFCRRRRAVRPTRERRPRRRG